MQFYAIEIARNRLGLNDWIYEREHPEDKKPAAIDEKKDEETAEKTIEEIN
jgi:hypothetical protein